MTPAFSINFLIDRVSESYKIQLTDESDYTGASTGYGFYKVTYPDGIIVENTDVENPDFDLGSAESELNLRLKNGKLITGQYTILQKIYTNIGDFSLEKSFSFSFVDPALSVEFSGNLLFPSVIFQDTTDYAINNYTSSITRELACNFPAHLPISGTELTSSTEFLNMIDSGNYYEGLYNPSLSVTVIYTGTEHTVEWIQESSFEISIKKILTLDDLASLFNQQKAEVDGAVGKPSYQQALEDYQTISALYNHIQVKIKAGDTGSEELMQELQELVYKISCACCCDDDEYEYSTDPLVELDFSSEIESGFNAVADQNGLIQFISGLNKKILFQGIGGTTVSFDPATNKVIIGTDLPDLYFKKQGFEYSGSNVFTLAFTPLLIVGVSLNGQDLDITTPTGVTTVGSNVTIPWDLEADDFIQIKYLTGAITAGALSEVEVLALLEVQKDVEGGIAANDTSILSLNIVEDFDGLDRRGRTRFYVNDLNRGGMFSYSAEDLTPDGGTIFAIADGFAVRNFSGPVNVKWFGAAKDGTTDATAAVQAALNFFDEVVLDQGDVFACSTLTLSGSKKIYGGGTIKCTSAVNLFSLNGNHSFTLEYFRIDMNNTGGRFIIKDSTGCQALNLLSLEIFNISAPIFTLNGGGQINENVKISGCKFTCTNNISLGTFYSIRNYHLVNNLFRNCSCPAYTNQSGLPPLTNPKTGKIFISGNIFEGLSILDTNLSVILVRTNSSLFLSDVVIVNNIICGGKLGININEDSSGEMDRLVVSGNSIRNFVNAGIKISNPGVITRDVVVSGNSISNDFDQIINSGSSQRGINLRSDSYVIQGNSISNCGNGGIVVEGDGIVNGNNIFKCATRTDTSTTEEGGIYVVFGSVNITGNKINDIGYVGALWASGISLNNSALINKCIISNNIINDTQATKTMAYCIRLSRFAGSPHPDNILISGNYLGGQATAGSKIYFRANTQNTQKIFGNTGWGELITTMDPGVMADGATYSANFTIPGAFVVDTVQVKFDGFRLQTGLTNRFKWLISANVTADNTVAVNITNLTGASQTFDTAHTLRLAVERNNIAI